MSILRSASRTRLVLAVGAVLPGCTADDPSLDSGGARSHLDSEASDTARGGDTGVFSGDSGATRDTQDTPSCPESTWTWPVASDPELGLRLNDTFGPRIQSSADRYDFHRGIDISRDEGTPVFAVAAGEVTIAGEHESYQDMTIQVRHPLADGTFLIAHYTHLSEVEADLEIGDRVEQGESLGRTGQGTSSYPHLHFELRASETGSSYQRNAVHPLGLLPYDNPGPPVLDIREVSRADADHLRVDLTLATAADEPDLVGVEVVVSDATSGAVLSGHSYDMNVWNAAHETVSDLDEQVLDGVLLEPREFNDRDYETWELAMSFLELEAPEGATVDVRVTATDARGDAVSASVTETL